MKSGVNMSFEPGVLQSQHWEPDVFYIHLYTSIHLLRFNSVQDHGRKLNPAHSKQS